MEIGGEAGDDISGAIGGPLRGPQAHPEPPCVLKKSNFHLPGTSSKRKPFKYSVSGIVEMIG